jgi:nucleoside triphosphate pyrophosphatase
VNAASPTLILASASPRRRELLGFLGVLFSAISTDAEEQDDPPPHAVVAGLPPAQLSLATHPTLLAWRKAHAACAEVQQGVIIGADTIVVLDRDVLGKPRDADHARELLRWLSGRQHTVYTGLAVIKKDIGDSSSASENGADDDLESPVSNLLLDLVASEVTLAELSDAEIAAYVETGEPLDKAGAYGIQGLGGRLVREVVGSYTCVVGLPLVETHRLLAAGGVTGLLEPAEAYRRWLGAQGKEPLPCPPTFP